MDLRIIRKLFLWILNKYKVHSIYRFQNGAIIIFDEDGMQIPNLQGFVAVSKKGKVWKKVKK